MLRESVCVSDSSAISARSCGVVFLIPCRFSRIRSKITIVSFTEYPTIVRIHAINVLHTEIRISAYAVITTSTSCTSARIALVANLISLNLNQI